MFAAFDSLVSYLDTASVEESIIQSLFSSIVRSKFLKFLCYAALGACLGELLHSIYFISEKDNNSDFH